MLKIDAGQHSRAGRKPVNEDSCGLRIPDNGLLESKGIAAVVADGVSASDGGREASEACVRGFLSDYFSTPESWTVKTSAAKILSALNSWLHSRSHSVFNAELAMVTTVSALIVKSSTAYLFHVGDTRVYLYRDGDLELLTDDHRVQLAGNREYLGRALGMDMHLDIDYRTLSVQKGDVFMLATDGVHEHISDSGLSAAMAEVAASDGDLEAQASAIVQQALDNGSADNLTCQLIRIADLPSGNRDDLYQRLTELPFPPELEPGMVIDGFRIVRELHVSKRSQVYLAVDVESDTQVVIKTPSVNYIDDAEYIDRFTHEGWVGCRLKNNHVLRSVDCGGRRHFLYHVTEYIEGQTLRQWMHDNPQPTLVQVRDIIGQTALGLRAFHRLEMIHQDLKPENILIDRQGTVKIVDFGSTRIAGVEEVGSLLDTSQLLGTRDYTAPEYMQGYKGSNRSDIFSLGVIAYEMMTGHLPYGSGGPEHGIPDGPYTPAMRYNGTIPAWVNGALQKAVQRNPEHRYPVLSEFLYDLEHPNPALTPSEVQPLLERDPLLVWKGIALLLFVISVIEAWLLSR